MQLDPQRHILGVLAGAGEYPRLVIEGARRAGVRVVCAGFRGAVGREIPPLCDAFKRFRVGAVEAPTRFFAEQGVTHVLMAGQIKPACIYTMWPDATARRLLAQLQRRNAHTLFGAVCRYGAEQGWQVLPSTTFMEPYMPGVGHIAGPLASPEQMEEARHGLVLAREIARLDIGQSLVVHGRQAVCVEAFKGTNECLREGGGRPYATTLCKVTKPGHDMRFDVPCIGLDTIRHCVRFNVRHIVIEAGRTILFQREKVAALCAQHGITLHALEVPEEGVLLPELPPTDSDAAHARALARAMARLGVGGSAVVCDGVVIAVEDTEGPFKCLRRAGAYMRRLRLVRLVNWLVRLLLGIPSAPPAPMVMALAPGVEPLPELCRAARRAGVQLLSAASDDSSR